MKSLFSILTMAALFAFSSSTFGLSVKPGFDLLKTKEAKLKIDTLPGVALSAPLKLKLKGNPLKKKGLGNTDTKIKRKKVNPTDNSGSESKIDIELVSLSLRSVAPVKIASVFYDAKVKLDPKKRSVGKTKITSHDDRTGQGKFMIDDLNVFLRVHFTPVTGSALALVIESLDVGFLSSSGGSWSHQPEEYYPTIPNLPSGNFFTQSSTPPFSLGNSIFSLSSLMAARVSVSLPGSLLLLGTGLLLIASARKRGRSH